MKPFVYFLIKIIAIILVIIGLFFLFTAIIGYSKVGNIQASSMFLAISVASLVAGIWLSKYEASLKNEKNRGLTSVSAKYESEFPEKWSEIFSLIEKAGGVKMPLIKGLTKNEQFKIRINWLAFFFGPFYYLALGMWRQTITYLFVMIVMFETMDYVTLTYFGKENFHISGVAAGFVWAMLANVNYYKLKVLREKNWV